LAFVLTAGQAADSPQFVPVLGKVRVRGPVGRPRTRPDAIAGDKAYSSRGNRAHLRKRRIKAVIPEKTDQAANRKKRGSRGGRPVRHDPDLYSSATPWNDASTESRSSFHRDATGQDGFAESDDPGGLFVIRRRG